MPHSKNLGFLLLAGIGFAQAALANDNVLVFPVQNMRITVGLTSHERNVNVSGTNVNLQFHATAAGIAEPPQPAYDRAEILYLKVKCTSTAGMDITFPPPPPGPPPPSPTITKTIRIASTHFNDGATIAFEVVGRFRLIDDDLGGLPTWENDVPHNPSVKAYNRLQLLGQNKSWLGELYPPIQQQSDLLTQSASATSISSHTVDPAAGSPARNESALSITQKITESTFMVALTHGTPNSFSDSNMLSDVWFNFGFGLPDVHIEVMQKPAAGLPPYNLACFWSCATLHGGSTTPVDGFEIVSPDQAYLGFAESINLYVWTAAEIKLYGNPPSIPPTHGLSEHASVFFNHLWLGDTVAQALGKANASFPPAKNPGGVWSIENMQVRGDPYTRMRYVYLNQEERNILGNDISKMNVWWIALPVTNP